MPTARRGHVLASVRMLTQRPSAPRGHVQCCRNASSASTNPISPAHLKSADLPMPGRGYGTRRGEIVHHDDVARSKSAHQLLLDVRQQDSAIRRAVNHQRRGQAIRVYRGGTRTNRGSSQLGLRPRSILSLKSILTHLAESLANHSGLVSDQDRGCRHHSKAKCDDRDPAFDPAQCAQFLVFNFCRHAGSAF
jgi:hypothetical protein